MRRSGVRVPSPAPEHSPGRDSSVLTPNAIENTSDLGQKRETKKRSEARHFKWPCPERHAVEGFPSGQRDQTVNLTALPSEVRILPPPKFSPPRRKLDVRC